MTYAEKASNQQRRGNRGCQQTWDMKGAGCTYAESVSNMDS